MNKEEHHPSKHARTLSYWWIAGVSAISTYESILSILERRKLIDLAVYDRLNLEPLTHASNMLGSMTGAIIVRYLAETASGFVLKKTNDEKYSNFTRAGILAVGISLIAATHLLTEVVFDIPMNVEDRVDALYGLISLIPSYYAAKNFTRNSET